MLALRTGVAVAAIVAGTMSPQLTAIAAAQTPEAAEAQEQRQEQAQDQDNGRRQGDLMDALLGHLDVSRGDVISHVRTGGTLAELAEENGSSGDELVDVLMAVVDAKIDQAIADGADPERAEEFRANAAERITNMVFSTHDGPGGNPGIGNGEAKDLLLDTVMDFLDVNKGEVVSHVRTGGTLAELADENGSSGPELEAALVAAVQARVDQAIDDGKISEERGDEIVANAAERINEVVYKVHTPGQGR